MPARPLAFSAKWCREHGDRIEQLTAQYIHSPNPAVMPLLMHATVQYHMADDVKANGGLAVPHVLILHAEDDANIPVAKARQVAELLPQAQLVVLPEVGHFWWVEEPDKSMDVIARFLKPLD
jgi:pimeloyl-ACP methyl ester carboxylesterase